MVVLHRVTLRVMHVVDVVMSRSFLDKVLRLFVVRRVSRYKLVLLLLRSVNYIDCGSVLVARPRFARRGTTTHAGNHLRQQLRFCLGKTLFVTDTAYSPKLDCGGEERKCGKTCHYETIKSH